MRKRAEIPMPGELLSMNQIAGKRWSSYHRDKVAWRESGYYHGVLWREQLRSSMSLPLPGQVLVNFDFDVKGHRRRDGHNYSGTVCKWFIDGMVIAKLIEDDSADHLLLRDSTFVVTDRTPPTMRVLLTALT